MAEHPKKVESQNKSYKIADCLGEGGTSIVYLANDGARDIALKILGEEVDPKFKEQYVQILKNEFEVLSKLRHPNIAQVYDFEYAPALNKYFFTTEYVKGTDIYAYTERLDYKAKEELFVQMLVALDYVHRNGLIHCDVKCGNALVTLIKKTPVVKLVDFGFATRRLISSGNVVGTLAYMAPELLMQSADINHRVDIYAAGILFYRLLHRAYPHNFTETKDIIRWHKEHDQIAFSNDVPEYARHLINRMTAVYPSDRIVSCAKAVEFINLRTEGRYKTAAEKIVTLQFREGPFVGRNELLEKIVQTLSEIKSAKTPSEYGYAFIGAQGLGKSRLLREIKYRAELEEIPIREFACVAGHDHVEEFFDRFREIPKPAIATTGEAVKVAEIRWLNDLAEKFQKSGLIVIADDLQLGSSAFINFMSLMEERIHVRRTEGSLPILILIGSRPGTELDEISKRWFDKTRLAKIELEPLKEGDVSKYISEIGIKEKHGKDILNFSGGVPGLIEAFCQHLLSPEGMARPPESLAQSYLERFSHLPNDSKLCIEFLSVAQRNLTLTEIAALIEKNKDAATSAVQKTVPFGFVSVAYPSMEVSISNKAMSQVIKSNMDAKRAKQISSKLGQWLESHEPAATSEIADYFSQGEVKDKALKYARLAAEHFEERFNNSEAARYYEMAISYAENESQKKRLVRSAAKMDILMGKYKEPISSLEKLITSGDKSLENFRLLGMAYTKMRDFANAKQWYESGLRQMTDETAITDIVQFKNSLGNVSFYMGDLENSERYFTEAIADATVCLLLNNNLGLILNTKGNYEQALKFYESRKKYLSAKANKRALSLCCAEFGYIHMTNNRFHEAIKEFEESRKLAEESSDWYNILVILGNLIRCHQELAEYSRALDYALKGMELETSLGSVEEIAQNHLTIGILYETIGILDLARQHIGMALDRFSATSNKAMLGWCHLAMSYLYKDLNKLDDAVAELKTTGEIASNLKLKDLDSWAKGALADTYYEYGKTGEAISVIKEIAYNPSLEFELRIKLIKLKTGFTKKEVFEFTKLADECKNYPELAWEANAAMARWLEDEGKKEEAFAAYAKAASIIESIANNLSEAYRDSYKNQQFRRAVLQKISPQAYRKKDTPSSEGSIEGNTAAIKN